MMGRRAFLSMAAVVALLAAGLGLWAAAPASAAPKPIGLSYDGVTFTDTLPTTLYAGAIIVPGDEVLRSFYVQNRAADAGNLAVSLQDVTGVDSAMISVLSIKAVAGTTAGPTVGFPAASPCASLVSGAGLAAGQIARVDVRLRLGSSLTGLTAQTSVGEFDLHITLTSTDVAAPTGCSAVTPPTGGGGTGGAVGGGGHSTTPGEIDSAVVIGMANGTLPEDAHQNACFIGEGSDGTEPTEFSGQAGVGCHGVAAAIIQPNTGRFFQEFDIVAWIALMLVGGIFAAWRRSRDPEDEYAPVRVATDRVVPERAFA